MIEVSNLTKEYGSFHALKGISFSVSKGDILGLLGPNGAGKTTTLKILTSFIPFISGSVQIAGYDLKKDSLKIRQLTGYLPESNPLYPEMRVSEFLTFRAQLKKVPRKKCQSQIQKVLEQCQLTELPSRIIGTLSKGMQQRVGLAEALVADPDILILDEPTIGLDPHQVRQFRQLIRELAQNRTVIFSSHILSEVEALCSKVVILNQGRKVAEETPQNVMAQIACIKLTLEVKAPLEEARELFETLPHVVRVVAEPIANKGWSLFEFEIEQGVDLREELFSLVAEKGWTLRELKASSRNLEEAFVSLTPS